MDGMTDGSNNGVANDIAANDVTADGVTALILAAGVSRRMGQMKQLLDLGGRPLLERVIRQLVPLPFSEIVAVIGYRAECVRRDIAISDERFRWIVNTEYDRGQSASLQKGMAAIGSSHTMVFLADQPFIAPDTIRAVYDQGVRQGTILSQRPFVVRPSYRSEPGHPVFFGHVKRLDFAGLSGDQGAKPIISEMDNLHLLPVDDEYISFDIDTPDAYKKAKRIWAYRCLNGHTRPDPGIR